MKQVLMTGAAAFIAMLSTGARAESFHEQCREDISSFCSFVEPGDGRVVACLYAHTYELSEECYDATDEPARVLEGVFDRLTDVYHACESDIQDHCSDITASGGRLLTCLQSKEPELTAACGVEMQSFEVQVVQ